MTDHPTLFSAPMVRALIDGRKTMTRRVIKPSNFKLLGHDFRFHRPDVEWLRSAFNGARAFRWIEDAFSWVAAPDYFHPPSLMVGRRGKPKFAPGDRLWVKEPFAQHHPAGVQEGRFSIEGTAGIPAPPGVRYRVIYRADGDPIRVWHCDGYPYRTTSGPRDDIDARHPRVCSEMPGWTAGRFMPRRYSRLTLIVRRVRIERLQDISEEDAAAEGVCSFVESLGRAGAWAGLSPEHRLGLVRNTYGSCRQAFWHLWDTINGPGAWEANPWVTATSFEVHRQNIDNLGMPS